MTIFPIFNKGCVPPGAEVVSSGAGGGSAVAGMAGGGAGFASEGGGAGAGAGFTLGGDGRVAGDATAGTTGWEVVPPAVGSTESTLPLADFKRLAI